MEKIQAALEKARARRDVSGQGAAQPTVPPSSPATGRKARLWADIKEIAMSPEALSHHRVVTQKASDEAAPFDILRTKVLLQMRQNGWKRLAITSPMPQSGKTTTACNLALGLGRQSGLRVMLFDMDLKNPSVSKFIGYRAEVPIADMLSKKVAFADQAVRVGENVAISLSENIETDPTRILLSHQTEETLDELQATYEPDMMIFDMPSILMGDNTRAFLKNVDCALIVARANTTRYGHFDTCEREVAEHTNVVGVVLNAFRTKDVHSYIEG